MTYLPGKSTHLWLVWPIWCTWTWAKVTLVGWASQKSKILSENALGKYSWWIWNRDRLTLCVTWSLKERSITLSGPIHGSLWSLVYLPVLNLSCGDLPRRIPTENLLCAYKGDSYLENVNFRGAPVSRICLPNSSEHQHLKLQHFYMLT